MPTGEQQAWKILAELDPEDVCVRATVLFDKTAYQYILKSFSQDIYIFPKEKNIFAISPTANLLLNSLGRYSRLSILWYLINSKDISLSGELIKPGDLSGGAIYLKGTHVLPLDKLAEKYSGCIGQFIKRGVELGGEELGFGDASIRLWPFPRVPVVLIIWKGDEEFPARAYLLFDSTCQVQLPADVIWSTATMSLLVML